MISACPMFLMRTSCLDKPYFFKQDCTASSPVELLVSKMVRPFIAAGWALICAAAALLTINALAADSSLVRPMGLMPKRIWPSTAGTEPVGTRSQDLAAAAASCGTPAGKMLNTGCRPSSAHQFFSVATKNGKAQYSAGWELTLISVSGACAPGVALPAPQMPQMPPPTTALSKARRSRVLTGVLTGVFIGVSIVFSSSHDNEKTIARRRHSVRAPVMRLTQLFPYPGAKLHERGLLHHVLDARQRVPALGLANGLDGDDVPHRAGAACHHHDAVGQVHRLFPRMGDEKHGAGMAARHAHQLLLHHDAGLRVERAEGFIHQQHLRVEHVDPGNRHPLLHAARELVGKGLFVALQAHQCNVLPDALRSFGRRDAQAVQAEPDVVPDGLPGKERKLLEHHPPLRCPAAPRPGPGRVPTPLSTIPQPPVGCSRPAAMRMQVVLPQPDGPTMATNSRAPTRRLTPRRATTSRVPWRNVRSTSLNWIVAMGLLG